MSWGLALGGRGLRCAAHIGVLKVLTKYKLQPDFIAGAGTGAVVAAYYAAGTTPEKMESLISLGLKGFSGKGSSKLGAELVKGCKHGTLPIGLLDGNNLEKILKTTLSNKEFSQLAIPASILATDLETGQAVAYSNKAFNNSHSNAVFIPGVKLHEAVRASLSIPVLFAPQKIGSHWLVDCGVADSILVDVLLDMGADRVLAVDLETSKIKEADNMIKILLQTMDVMSAKLAELSASKGNLILKPETGNAELLDVQKIPQFIKAGEDAANADLEAIKKIASGK